MKQRVFRVIEQMEEELDTTFVTLNVIWKQNRFEDIGQNLIFEQKENQKQKQKGKQSNDGLMLNRVDDDYPTIFGGGGMWSRRWGKFPKLNEQQEKERNESNFRKPRNLEKNPEDDQQKNLRFFVGKCNPELLGMRTLMKGLWESGTRRIQASQIQPDNANLTPFPRVLQSFSAPHAPLVPCNHKCGIVGNVNVWKRIHEYPKPIFILQGAAWDNYHRKGRSFYSCSETSASFGQNNQMFDPRYPVFALQRFKSLTKFCFPNTQPTNNTPIIKLPQFSSDFKAQFKKIIENREKMNKDRQLGKENEIETEGVISYNEVVRFRNEIRQLLSKDPRKFLDIFKTEDLTIFVDNAAQYYEIVEKQCQHIDIDVHFGSQIKQEQKPNEKENIDQKELIDDIELRNKQGLLIVGDIHGNFYALLKVLDIVDDVLLRNDPSRGKVVFLGDYIDRGIHSLECVILIIAYKLAFPDRIFLIRVTLLYHISNQIVYNHKTQEIPKSQRSHIHENQTQTLDQTNTHNFQNLYPIIHSRRIQLNHGGITPIMPVASAEDECTSLPPEDQYQISEQLGFECNEVWTRNRAILKFTTWGDPSDYENIIQGRPPFCQETTDRYVRANGIDVVVRAHEDSKQGFYFPMHNGKVATIFSSDTYSQQTKGSVFLVRLSSPSERFNQDPFINQLPTTHNSLISQTSISPTSYIDSNPAKYLPFVPLLTFDAIQLESNREGYRSVGSNLTISYPFWYKQNCRVLCIYQMQRNYVKQAINQSK
ncbi:MAG: hypothetical protein EZS28_000983 [Streblomastix strix]|uniref:protein-serine/threonine phosphatase n=1 Tax=Streblomastix strix TaxID=222440 RepID=A0A5J4XAE1_9EUKA|nr:MAG: hypothetical protein EZS28_000983 [Streblomastix strix]